MSENKDEISKAKKTARNLKATGGALGKTFGITSKILGTAGKVVGTVVTEVVDGVTTVDGFVRQGYHVLKNGANMPTEKEKTDIHKYVNKFPEYVEWALINKVNEESPENTDETDS